MCFLREKEMYRENDHKAMIYRFALQKREPRSPPDVCDHWMMSPSHIEILARNWKPQKFTLTPPSILLFKLKTPNEQDGFKTSLSFPSSLLGPQSIKLSLLQTPTFQILAFVKCLAHEPEIGNNGCPAILFNSDTIYP